MEDRPRRLVRLPSRMLPSQMVGDVIAVAVASVVVVGLSRSPQVVQELPQPVTDIVAAVVTAALATSTAVLAANVARLTGDPRARWIAAAVVLYTVAVVPLTSFVVVPDDDATQRGARQLAYLVVVGLLAVGAGRPPRRVGGWCTWSIAAGGALLTLLALRVPAVARTAGYGVNLLVIVSLVGAAGAVAVLVGAYRRLNPPWWRIGLGVMVVVVVQIYRIGTVPPDARSVLTVDGLRLLGLLTIVAGVAQLSGRAMADLRSEQSAQQEELLIALVHMERAGELAAERDHELRNGLAGLAGITHLLSLNEAGLEHERLRHAVLAELGRLNTLLDTGDVRDEAEQIDYRVEPLLVGLAILRRSAGAAVEVEIDPALHVHGDPAVLAQVVTNLLANCERHAPGARVELRARSDGDQAVVEVRDTGPGLPVQLGASALDRGVQDSAAGGSGLGLYISRQLIERQGGSLQVRTVHDPRGCLAVVTVPQAELDPR